MGMYGSGTGPLTFTDETICMYDDSRRMNLEECKTILATNNKENATRFIGKYYILHQNKDPKQDTFRNTCEATVTILMFTSDRGMKQ